MRLGRPSTLSRELAARIVCEHRDGAALSSIAQALTKEDVPTAHGGKWWPATVRKVLQGQEAARAVA
ncbi:MAG TPA: recombinase family protein [Microbacteriaceae bacterium]|nr:recombinase family protein [Microbacteriaceae bacterium]